ncbi:MAG: hypothetical protein WCV67_08915 [Victivallaceae bacterium]
MNCGKQKTVPAAWYALRRTLPLWRFEENFNELIAKAEDYRLDEVIIKVDVEEFSHGQLPLWYLESYLEKLFRIKTELEKRGICYSLNPWITHGHGDRGRCGQDVIPGLVTMVGTEGQRSTACACSLSTAWQEHTKKLWTLYARTMPHVIWVEDDIRSFGHGPVKYGCFCELHLREFSRRVNREVSREELVAAITAPGEPHPWRGIYLDMQRETMIDTVRMLSRTVHAFSPDTMVGLMSSGPHIHCIEGRNWNAFAAALADGKQLYSRPTLGDNYTETNLRNFREGAVSIKLTRHVLPDAIEQTEVENYPYTPFAKSVSGTFLQLALSFGLGCRGVAMNLFDHLGTMMEVAPGYGRMLATGKDYLNALAATAQTPGRWRGVRLLHHDQSFLSRNVAGRRLQDIKEDGFNTAMLLEGMGIANDYGDSSVTMVSGQTIRAYSDAEIRKIFSSGVLLDAVAAAALVDRGYGRLIGVEKIIRRDRIYQFGPYSVEEYLDSGLELGGESRYNSLRFGNELEPMFTEFALDSSCRIMSRLADFDAVCHQVSAFRYENELGGRICGWGFDFEETNNGAFCTPVRVLQMQDAIRWASGDKPDFLVTNDGSWTMALRKDCADFILLEAFNFSPDPWTTFHGELTLDRKPAQVLQLSQDGYWSKSSLELSFDGGILRLSGKISINFQEPLILKLLF